MASRPLPSLRPRQLTLWDLPVEIREQIYDQAIPVRRLCTSMFGDEYHSLETAEGRALPGLIFVSRQVYKECIELFYAKAILEISVPRVAEWAYALSEDVFDANATRHLDMVLSFLPQMCKDRLQRVHLFRDDTHRNPWLTADAYEATLRWLVQHTGVKEIEISRALLFRPRKRRIEVNPDSVSRAGKPCVERIVRIYCRSGRCMWEMNRIHELRRTYGGELLFTKVQMYLCSDRDGEMRIQSDPRWDLRGSDEGDRKSQASNMGHILDSYRDQYPDISDSIASTAEPPVSTSDEDAIHDRWLYQVIFVV